MKKTTQLARLLTTIGCASVLMFALPQSADASCNCDSTDESICNTWPFQIDGGAPNEPCCSGPCQVQCSQCPTESSGYLYWKNKQPDGGPSVADMGIPADASPLVPIEHGDIDGGCNLSKPGNSNVGWTLVLVGIVCWQRRRLRATKLR